MSTPDILTAKDVEALGVFDQKVPEDAFQEQRSVEIAADQVITDLSQAVQRVAYPIFVLKDQTYSLQLVSTEFRVGTVDPISAASLPGGIHFAPRIGIGIKTIYASPQTDRRLTIIQGPTEPVRTALQKTRPTWVKATQVQILLAHAL
ncbi:MAG: hypothetical protein ACREBU_26340 [Nitrososphaera sp.]